MGVSQGDKGSDGVVFDDWQQNPLWCLPRRGAKGVTALGVESLVIPQKYILFYRDAISDDRVYPSFVNIGDHLLSFKSVPARDEA